MSAMKHIETSFELLEDRIRILEARFDWERDERKNLVKNVQAVLKAAGIIAE